MPHRVDALATLLAEGLDLCERARNLDRDMDKAVLAGSHVEEETGTRCLTPAYWAQAAYDRDLAQWEKKTKDTLIKFGLSK